GIASGSKSAHSKIRRPGNSHVDVSQASEVPSSAAPTETPTTSTSVFVVTTGNTYRARWDQISTSGVNTAVSTTNNGTSAGRHSSRRSKKLRLFLTPRERGPSSSTATADMVRRQRNPARSISRTASGCSSPAFATFNELARNVPQEATRGSGATLGFAGYSRLASANIDCAS